MQREVVIELHEMLHITKHKHFTMRKISMFAMRIVLLHDVKHTRCFRIHRMGLKDRLQEARKHSGKSMDQVAQDLGLSRIQVWRMEKNAEAITVKRLRELADVYGRPIQSFFDDNVEISETEVSYQIIGMAFEAVESAASRMAVRPSPTALRSAAIAVIRVQQKRWAENPELPFNPEEFTVFIENELDRVSSSNSSIEG